MARRQRQKPSDPEAARLARRVRALTDVGLQPEAAYLVAHSEVEVTRVAEERAGSNGKKVSHTVARRMDAFEALKEGMVHGAYDAARRYERDVIDGLCLGNRGRSMMRVDCDKRDGEYRFLEAADNAEFVRGRLSPLDAFLLTELVVPSREYDGWCPSFEDGDGKIQRGAPWYGWRAIVAYVTGELNKDAQGAVVRHACANLRDAYQDMERRAAA